MSLKQQLTAENDLLDQLAGITGLGWTVSILGYLGTLIGYGNSIVARLVVDPQSLLYIGGAFFVATFGLDRLRNQIINRD
ncbi:hypothetical protein HSRCO_1717 [Halanaeroarchaeum sp. HSR-CO]|uniref:hypothetical protein n=1 Tax=Halanaeroarchaeum sp. HSR-CO TaxID=2866382 RepID=UPI00217EAF3E|nr:hypothetical protein [Halanaeroarchaeum sp. HSR-CO]UWG47996.1 hypothetical protein HSRCO_1717 [Halanaeroarchaeum sp. HSR-CO]